MRILRYVFGKKKHLDQIIQFLPQATRLPTPARIIENVDPRDSKNIHHLDSKIPLYGWEILLVIPMDIAYDLGNGASSLPVVALMKLIGIVLNFVIA